MTRPEGGPTGMEAAMFTSHNAPTGIGLDDLTFVVGPGGELSIVTRALGRDDQPVIARASCPISRVPLRPGPARRG